MQNNALAKIFALITSFFLGGIFIYSGIAKLWPNIESFEVTLVDGGVAGWSSAPVIARVLIGIEFAVGFLLLVCYRLRFTTSIALSLLLLFSVHLIVQIVKHGDSGNCGCFGEYIPMTPGKALLKNGVMMLMTVFVFLFSTGWAVSRSKIFVTVIFALSVSIPFIFNQLEYNYSSGNMGEAVDYRLRLDLLYDSADRARVDPPQVELRRGKQVIAFLSVACSHCRHAAFKLGVMYSKNPDLPLYMLLTGEKERLKNFFDDTRTSTIPNSFCKGRTFSILGAARIPAIFLVDDGIVKKKLDHYELSQAMVEEWLK